MLLKIFNCSNEHVPQQCFLLLLLFSKCAGVCGQRRRLRSSENARNHCWWCWTVGEEKEEEEPRHWICRFVHTSRYYTQCHSAVRYHSLALHGHGNRPGPGSSSSALQCLEHRNSHQANKRILLLQWNEITHISCKLFLVRWARGGVNWSRGSKEHPFKMLTTKMRRWERAWGGGHVTYKLIITCSSFNGSVYP